MRLNEILNESVDVNTAISVLRSSYISFIAALQQMADIATRYSDDKRLAKMQIGRLKAKWVETDYLSGRKTTGLQPAAATLASVAKGEELRNVLKRLANVKLLAYRDSGRSQTFNIIGKNLIDLGAAMNDKGVQNLADRVNQGFVQIEKNLEKSEPVKAVDNNKEPKAKTNVLRGQQQTQAEAAFNAAIANLPSKVQARIRDATKRMDPGEKMRYLQQNQQLFNAN